MAYDFSPFMQLLFYGSGLDGNVTVTSSNYTGGPLTNGKLTRDAHFENLTISGSGRINTNGFKLFVQNVLDISGATGIAIDANGVAGSAAVGATGGAGANTPTFGGTIGYCHLNAPTGRNGSTGNGLASTSGGSTSIFFGGTQGSTGGSGGNAGNGNTGGAGAGGGALAISISACWLNFHYASGTDLYSAIHGGMVNNSGASGAGDGTNAGGGGGGAGTGAGVVYIQAQTINRSSSNVVGAIQAIGGDGGAGAAGTGGNAGGGGGGGAGGGGFVYILYSYLTGTTATNCIDVSSGTSGAGGNGVGTGLGGRGGNGGGGGRYAIINMRMNQRSGVLTSTAGSPPAAPTTSTGGLGAAATNVRVNL